MTHLLSISIGPVQDFIAAARRTNDLYTGSELISEITRAAAIAIKDKGGELIFPAPETVKDTKKSIPNKILAQVEGDPKAVAVIAEAAAKKRLQDEWVRAQTKLGGQIQQISDESAKQQIDTFIEFFAAWHVWDGVIGESYKKARTQVELLLAGRKALRDFKQPQKRPGVHKSALDPSRDSVVLTPKSCSDRPLRLKDNEWLDAVSVLKRAQGYGKTVPSTSDIAARTLEHKLANSRDERNVSQLALLHQIAKPGLIGDLVFESRRKDILDEARDLKEETPESTKVNQAIEAFKASDFKISEADPYYAILVADGDRMGAAISEIESPEEHRKLSVKLASFAHEAKAIVDNHNGHLVYSGGDDVLALLPIHTCAACAARLASEFATEIKVALPNGSTFTGSLSVGIAIVHYHDPLQVGLRHAREAEKKAKNKTGHSKDRGNRLAMTFHVRGGQDRTAIWNWQDGYDFKTAVIAREAGWRIWTDAFRMGLSHGFPYELAQLAREAKGAEISDEIPPEALRAEALRIFDRKKKAEEGAKLEGEDLIRAGLSAVNNAQELAELAQQVIVFRALAAYPVQWEVKP